MSSNDRSCALGVVAVPAVFMVVRRTIIENRFWRQKLRGYARYEERVRYCLLLGLW